MKFLVALLSLVAGASATMPIYANKMHQLQDVKVDSKMGNSLLSKARKLNDEEEEVDMTWIVDFSIKFQGCHHVSQWNEEADEDEDVRISTKRLIRFRLCPSNTCSTSDAGGCSAGYGDYIIDMNTYLALYTEAVQEVNENRCQYIENYVCACADDDGQDDAFDEDKCLYDCYTAQGVVDICAEENPYNDDEQEQEERFELAEYIECKQLEVQNDDRRKLNDEEEVEYYMGPYCAEQGGAIFLGVFTDESCTSFADDNGGTSTYYSLTGSEMPYGAETIMGMDCVSCMEPAEDDGNDNDDEDEAVIIEMCEMIYTSSGKCETNLGVDSPNTNACTYMEGIKIVRRNGVVQHSATTANKTASVFIGLFFTAFVLLGAYVYYLRTKLDRASINLSE